MDGVNKKKNSFKETEVIVYEDATSEKYVPEGYSSQEEFLKEMREEYEADLTFDKENREAAIDDKKFAAGEQWDPVVLNIRQGLPNLVINTIPQFIAQLVGDWREAKRGVKVLPEEDGDKQVASIREDLIRAIEQKSRAARTYNSSFESAVQCGDGAFRISVEYAKNDVFDQDIFIRPIEDALSVVWDRYSIDPTGRDARHVFVDDKIPKKEFKRKWGTIEGSELSTSLKSELSGTGWLDEEGVRVTEFWRMIEREKRLGLFQDGSILFIEDEDDLQELTMEHGALVKERMSPCTYAQMHLVTGFRILSGPYEYKLTRVPIIRMIGRVVNVDGKRIRYGLTRFMKDPVRLRNFWRSVRAEQLGYAPRAQWIATESAVEGHEDKLRKAHLSRDPLLVVSDDAVIGQTIQRLDPPKTDMALMAESEANVQDMKDVTGIHDASLGIKSNEVSGRAISARQREGDVAALTFYDNANDSVLEGGDVINQLIGQIYDSTRIIRTIGEDERISFVKINDPMDESSPDLSIGKYDTALSTGTSYTTRRVEAAQAMMDAIQVWPQLMQVGGDLIAESQNWPGADKLAERLRKTIPPQFLSDKEKQETESVPQIDPQQMQELMMQVQTLQQENQAMKMDREIEFKKLEIDEFNAETKRMQVAFDADIKGANIEYTALRDEVDRELELERMDMQERQLSLKNNSTPAGSKATPAG